MPKAVKHEYAANLRRAFYEGLLEAAKLKDQTLTEYCRDWWIDDRKGAVEAMAKFTPREATVRGTVEHSGTVKHLHEEAEITKAWLEQVMADDQGEPLH